MAKPVTVSEAAPVPPFGNTSPSSSTLKTFSEDLPLILNYTDVQDAANFPSIKRDIRDAVNVAPNIAIRKQEVKIELHSHGTHINSLPFTPVIGKSMYFDETRSWLIFQKGTS
jgi:hypothetical protein